MVTLGVEMLRNIDTILANNDLDCWNLSTGYKTCLFHGDDEIGYTDDKWKKAAKEMNDCFANYNSIWKYEFNFELTEDTDPLWYTFEIIITETRRGHE